MIALSTDLLYFMPQVTTVLGDQLLEFGGTKVEKMGDAFSDCQPLAYVAAMAIVEGELQKENGCTGKQKKNRVERFGNDERWKQGFGIEGDKEPDGGTQHPRHEHFSEIVATALQGRCEYERPG